MNKTISLDTIKQSIIDAQMGVARSLFFEGTDEELELIIAEARADILMVDIQRLVKSVCEEVIGEDTNFDKNDPLYKLTGEPFQWAERNELKAEQRETLKRKLGE